MTKRLSDYPEEDGQDRALDFLRAITKATFGVLSPIFPEIIEFLFRKPIELRRNDWFIDLQAAVQELIDKAEGLTPAKLAENQEFVTVLHTATDIAIRTHESEKRKLLRNAILSAGSANPPELDKQRYFLSLVDDLTTNQVLILNFYRNPREWFRKHNRQLLDHYTGSRLEAVYEAYPEFRDNPDFKDLVLGELHRRGLLPTLGGMVSGEATYDPMTSRLGCEFLDYVAASEIET